MNEFKLHLYLFIIPGIIGNVAHMIVVKKNWLWFVAMPISSKLFGKNKTYRGLLFLPLAMGSVCAIESALLGPFTHDTLSDFLIGTGLGLTYMLAELPNSFLKRRRGISPGESSGDKKLLQLVIDKSDSLIGACVFYYFATAIEMNALLLLFAICFLLHISISYLLFIMNLKKSI